jgi:protein-tyrosine phosphatase
LIDLHSHILPGLDDGAADMEVSLAMARRAVDEGIQTVVATPHVSLDYPVDAEMIGRAVGELNLALVRAGIPLPVLPGGEVALQRLAQLDDAELRAICLGGGDCVLVESPYAGAAPSLDALVFELEARGFRPVLAHPERSAIFQREPERLRTLVHRGVMTSVTAASMAGRFGGEVKRFTLRLFRENLVHNVASDAHDDERRPLALAAGFEAAEAELPGLAWQRYWYTTAAPAAMLAGRPLPARPELPEAPRSRWHRLGRRRRSS